MSVDEIMMRSIKSKEEFDEWIEGAKGTAQEALFAAENMLTRAIPSNTNRKDYEVVRRALWRLKVIDRNDPGAVLDYLADFLSREPEWGPDTLDHIATTLRDAGRTVEDVITGDDEPDPSLSARERN